MMFAFAILVVLAVLAAMGLLSTTTAEEVSVSLPASCDPLATADEIEARQIEAITTAVAVVRSMDLTARQVRVASYAVDQIITAKFAPARIEALSGFQCPELQCEAAYLRCFAHSAPEAAQGAYRALVRDLAPAALLRFIEDLAIANNLTVSA